MQRLVPHSEYQMLQGLYTDPMSPLQTADKVALQNLLPLIKPFKKGQEEANHVKLHQKFTVRLEPGSQRVQIELCLPHEANPREQRISLFTPMGLALYGRSLGEAVACKLPMGERMLHVEQLPEAADHTKKIA